MPHPLEDFDQAAHHAARQVIARYSSSFSLASRLLAEPARTDIRNLYAVVRIADEIVDGAASPTEAPSLLDDYEHQIRAAHQHRFHTDPVIHAFAVTARRCNFRDEHLEAFFASMRRDLDPTPHDRASFDQYVYGSAEVIGLLCLDVFLAGQPRADRLALDRAARRLGAAFQKINFLRDRDEDAERGRSYLVGDLLPEVRADLAAARQAIPLLPLSARAGVLAATDLFEELTDLLERPHTGRVSVPRRRKLAITARAAAKAVRL